MLRFLTRLGVPVVSRATGSGDVALTDEPPRRRVAQRLGRPTRGNVPGTAAAGR